MNGIMAMEKKKIKVDKWYIWCAITVILNCIFWMACYFSHGQKMTQYFYQDLTDSFSDFFSMIKASQDKEIYMHGISYPPCAMLIFMTLARFVPMNMLTDIPYREMVRYVYPVVAYLMFVLLCYCGLFFILDSMLKCNSKRRYLTILLIGLSGPILFTIQRGNILLLSLVLTLYYSAFYSSANKFIRETAYIALAISAAVKIYPAIFGLLLLHEKRWKDVVRLIVYGLIFFLVPFAFYGGIKNIVVMFNSLNGSVFFSHGFGYNVSFINLCRICNFLCWQNDKYVTLVWNIIPLIISFVIYILADKCWKRTLALTLLLIWLPGYSYTYVLSFLLIPLVEFLNDSNGKFDWLYAVMFGFLLTPGAWGYVDVLNSLDVELWYPTTIHIMAVNIIILLFSVVLCIDNLIAKFKNRGNGEKKSGFDIL